MTRGRRSAPLAFVFALACALATARDARADAPAADASTASPAPCSIVGADDVARILGFAVHQPDASSRSGGICFFSTRAVSDDGSASYAIVVAADVPARRAFFSVLARRCAGVAPAAPRALVCASYAKLATVPDIAAYFDARTDGADTSAVPNLGDAAVATPDALYVRRGARVIESVVMRNGAFDPIRAASLAALVLARLGT